MNEWAKNLVGHYALHSETGVLGKVKAYREDPSPIIELEEGHTFHAIEENFTPLTDSEARFFHTTTAVMNHTITETIKLAASLGDKVSYSSTLIILEASLLAQIRLLRAAKPESAG